MTYTFPLVTQLFLLILASYLIDGTYCFSVNDVNCDNIPFSVDANIVFDKDLNLSNCSRREKGILRVINDPVIDCKGYEFIGFSDGTAIRVLGGATIKNCRFSKHIHSIFNIGGDSDKSTLSIQDCVFADGDVIVSDLSRNGKKVDVMVKDSHFQNIQLSGISMYASGTLHIEGSRMYGEGDNFSTGIYVSGTIPMDSLTVKNVVIQSLSEGMKVIKTMTGDIDIGNVYVDNCPDGMSFQHDFDNLILRNVHISGSRNHGLDIFGIGSNVTGTILLNDISVCGDSNAVGIRFSDLDIANDPPNVEGDLICDKARHISASNQEDDITSEYCTDSCSSLVS